LCGIIWEKGVRFGGKYGYIIDEDKVGGMLLQYVKIV
jgi:hypothetical protein